MWFPTKNVVDGMYAEVVQIVRVVIMIPNKMLSMRVGKSARISIQSFAFTTRMDALPVQTAMAMIHTRRKVNRKEQ
jgi:hypothetical protein